MLIFPINHNIVLRDFRENNRSPSSAFKEHLPVLVISKRKLFLCLLGLRLCICVVAFLMCFEWNVENVNLLSV